MSLQWTLIAGFLYAEIAVILLLLLPFLSNRAWNRLFKSRFLKGLESQLVYYFYVLVAILILFFLDAIREMRKYGDVQSMADSVGHTSHLDTQMQVHMRLFRAQRNFYLSGFALFLCLVIQRLVRLISSGATLEAEKDAAIKQASSASKAAETLMEETSSISNIGSDSKGLEELEEELEEALEALSKAKKDLDTMKAQAESVSEEYDRLCEDHSRLERKLAIKEGGSDGDEKED